MSREAELSSLVKAWFFYDPTTGSFEYGNPPDAMFRDARSAKIWRTKTSGLKPGWRGQNGYIYLTLRGQKLLAHRVAWFLHHGEWPKNYIDHINGNSADNRICNLRDVTHSVNMMNTRLRVDNRTGAVGVQRRGKRWIAQIKAFGSQQNLGSFETKSEAVAARLAAQEALPFGPRHGAGS